MKLKLKVLSIIWLTLFFYACTKDDETTPNTGQPYEETVISYFKEIALGFEFGTASKVTRKWKENMKVFVGGTKDPVLLAELGGIISEINGLTSNQFQIQVVEDSLQSNYYIFFGPGSNYAAIFPSQSSYISDNWALFSVNFNANNEIYRGHMYVDIIRADKTAQRHLLREELTQSLGLARDSKRFSDSIFQQDWTTTTQYSKLDTDLIKALYHPEMKTGLDANQVDPILRVILPQIL